MQSFDHAQIANLLISEPALPELTSAQALRLVPFMCMTLAQRDSVLFRDGGSDNPFLILMLEGDGVVEGKLTGAGDWVVLQTLVPGSLFGELGAMDSMARSVVVRATSETYVAALNDEALGRITREEPALAFALLRAVLAHVTRRLRSANRKIKTLHEINQTLRDEWADQMQSDHEAKARLSVLMKLEQHSVPRGTGSRPGWVRKRA